MSAADLTHLDISAPPLPVIFGVGGERLGAEEKAFLADANPLGVILFQRNCTTPEQVKALIAEIHESLGRVAPVLIDQEGGRVQRLKPPHWSDYPSAEDLGNQFLKNFTKGQDAVQEAYSGICKDLTALGISVNCAPVLDVLYNYTDPAIGDRSFGRDVDVVSVLGAQACRVHLESGVIPVVKHMPGLGRATLDTHYELAAIDASLDELERIDFFPYRQLLTKPFSEAVWGMVSHAVYESIDAGCPATGSRKVIHDVIREDLGFDGLLLSDDIDMKALDLYDGTAARAEKLLSAGCDVVLQCDGDLKKMKNVAARGLSMRENSVKRFNRTLEWLEDNRPAAAVA